MIFVGPILFKANKTNSQLPENAFNINELSNWLNFHIERRRVLSKDNNKVKVTFFTSENFHSLKGDTLGAM